MCAVTREVPAVMLAPAERFLERGEPGGDPFDLPGFWLGESEQVLEFAFGLRQIGVSWHDHRDPPERERERLADAAQPAGEGEGFAEERTVGGLAPGGLRNAQDFPGNPGIVRLDEKAAHPSAQLREPVFELAGQDRLGEIGSLGPQQVRDAGFLPGFPGPVLPDLRDLLAKELAGFGAERDGTDRTIIEVKLRIASLQAEIEAPPAAAGPFLDEQLQIRDLAPRRFLATDTGHPPAPSSLGSGCRQVLQTVLIGGAYLFSIRTRKLVRERVKIRAPNLTYRQFQIHPRRSCSMPARVGRAPAWRSARAEWR